MWAASRKARWSLLSLWAGLAAVLTLAAGFNGAGASGLDAQRADAAQPACSAETIVATRVARVTAEETE